MWGLSVAHTNEVNGHCVTDVAMVTTDIDTKKVCLSAGYVKKIICVAEIVTEKILY